ncbi:BMC domain-containing protein [Anaerobutyricum hallii]|nr:BMC domain-containing protein [Anaerobutyricum hallii]
MKRRIDAHVVMEKLVPRITEEYRKIYDIPENHESMAIFSADCEDVMWLAVDDATKKAKIKVIQIETVYGGVDYSWSRYGGEITAIISGEKVADVKSGLQYAKDYIENKSGNYSLNEEGHLAIMWIMYHGSESIIRSLWDLVRELLLPILYLHRWRVCMDWIKR